MTLELLNPIKEKQKTSMNKLELKILGNLDTEIPEIFEIYAR